MSFGLKIVCCFRKGSYIYDVGKEGGGGLTEFHNFLADAEKEGEGHLGIQTSLFFSLPFCLQVIKIECNWKRNISEAHSSREHSTYLIAFIVEA